MEILVVGDCHGEIPEIPDDRDFDLVLAVGDICGGTDEMRSAMFQARDEEEEWQEIFGKEEARREVEKSIEEGKEILEKLNSLEVPVLIVPGNWDWTRENSDWSFFDGKGYPRMLEEFENVHNLNFDAEEINDWKFVGYGPCSGPELPQYEDDEPETEEERGELQKDYQEKKDTLQGLMDGSDKTVLLSHNAPHNTSLDKIDNEDSPVHGRHYGSVIVRELVEEFSPEFSVAGHMHEAEGEETLKETKCLNTGLQNMWVLDTEEGFQEI